MERSNSQQHTLTYIPSRCRKHLLNICDTLLSLTVVTPLVVTYWYGTWAFMDQHPNYFPPIPTLLFGSVWHLMVVLSRHHVYDKVKTPEKEVKNVFGSISKYIFTRLFIYSFSINGIMAFRAIFLLCAPYGKIVFWVFIFFLNLFSFHYKILWFFFRWKCNAITLFTIFEWNTINYFQIRSEYSCISDGDCHRL